ncbi:hypothetical protein ACFQZC_08465 [Streptacidiphilus monticola]
MTHRQRPLVRLCLVAAGLLTVLLGAVHAAAAAPVPHPPQARLRWAARSGRSPPRARAHPAPVHPAPVPVPKPKPAPPPNGGLVPPADPSPTGGPSIFDIPGQVRAAIAGFLADLIRPW